MDRRDQDAGHDVVTKKATEQAVAMLEGRYSSNKEQCGAVVAVHEMIMKITTSF